MVRELKNVRKVRKLTKISMFFEKFEDHSKSVDETRRLTFKLGMCTHKGFKTYKVNSMNIDGTIY